MWDEVLLFLVPLHSEVKFLTRFDFFLDLVIFANFNAISIDFYSVKCIICNYFVQFPCLEVGECLYKRFICLKNFNELFYVFI